MNYKDAGVDIDKGNSFVHKIAPFAKKTFNKNVITNIGLFSALYKIDINKYAEPYIVSSTDGVGTKLKYAFRFNVHDTVGIDLVAMCVNDILTCGAEPLFFLDYLATGKLDMDIHTKVVKGIANGCAEAECALIGGETAELPGFYQGNEYDLAGFSVGIVDKANVIDGKSIKLGDIAIGIASSGLHSNGYSLVRKVLDQENTDYHTFVNDFQKTLAEEVLTPTMIYTHAVKLLLPSKRVKGMVNITGGGLIDNIPRIIPQGLGVFLTLGSWRIPNIFEFIFKKGGITDVTEKLRTFNCGIGFVVFVSPEDAEATTGLLLKSGYETYRIGKVVEGQGVYY
jgi:phosphoribosylformylglycinamidine cyclo-ligase